MISTDDLLIELGAHLGVTIASNSEELSTAEALLLLNRSHWEIIDKFPFREKEATLKVNTVAGVRSYIVPSPFEAIRQISVFDPNSEVYTPLERQTIYTHETDRAEINDTDKQDIPTHYLRETNKIRLNPVPDGIYTLSIKYWITLDDLATSSDLTLPPSWHEIVLLGAVWRGLLRMRDHTGSVNFKNQQLALINSSVPTEAKEEFDSHRAGLDVLGHDDYNWR
jgi:hypothetical protein